jgi:hypothetical protein
MQDTMLHFQPLLACIQLHRTIDLFRIYTQHMIVNNPPIAGIAGQQQHSMNLLLVCNYQSTLTGMSACAGLWCGHLQGFGSGAAASLADIVASVHTNLCAVVIFRTSAACPWPATSCC